MITGTTSSGFHYTVSEKLRNDFRFILIYSKMTGKDEAAQLTAQPELINLVLGEDGAEALYAHVAEEDGTIPADKLMAELAEIVTSSGKKDSEIKN